jgi:integrase
VGTREAAEKVRRTLEAKLALGDLSFLTEPDGDTFEKYSARWLKEYADVKLKASTAASYAQLLRLFVMPRFGAKRLSEIRRDEIKTWLAEMSEAGKLSRNTLRLALSTLRVILNHAVEDELIIRNPAEKLGRFTKTEKAKAEAAAMTKDEAAKLLEAVKELAPDYYPLFLVALRCGLRRGELVALQWGDIQFGANENDSNRFIVVQRNYVHQNFTTPKSKKSRRVDMSKQLRRVLLEVRDAQLLKAYLKGKQDISEDFVFPSQAGTVLDPDNLVHYYFQPALTRPGPRKFRFHDLRHTFGSLLIQDGASLAYVKEQMGHSTIQVTADVYGHLIPGANISWVDRLDEQSSPQQNATPTQPAEQEEKDASIERGELVEGKGDCGERGRNRTFNLLIKSQLLCQLSYAPICEEAFQKGKLIIANEGAAESGLGRRAMKVFEATALCVGEPGKLRCPLLDLHQLPCSNRSLRIANGLRRAPVVHIRHLMNARYRAVRRASLFS